MPWRAYYKRKLAAPGRLDSKALRADAAEAVSCAYLAGVLIVGLLLSRLLGWWWLGSVAAIALVPFIVIEAHEAASGRRRDGRSLAGPTQHPPSWGEKRGGGFGPALQGNMVSILAAP